MRKPTYLLAALLAAATPVAAQQAVDVEAAPQAPAEQPAAAQQPAPTIHVSDAEIRETLRQHDQEQGAAENAAVRRQVPMQYVWLAGAIAVGIIVAAIVL